MDTGAYLLFDIRNTLRQPVFQATMGKSVPGIDNLYNHMHAGSVLPRTLHRFTCAYGFR